MYFSDLTLDEALKTKSLSHDDKMRIFYKLCELASELEDAGVVHTNLNVNRICSVTGSAPTTISYYSRIMYYSVTICSKLNFVASVTQSWSKNWMRATNNAVNYGAKPFRVLNTKIYCTDLLNCWCTICRKSYPVRARSGSGNFNTQSTRFLLNILFIALL